VPNGIFLIPPTNFCVLTICSRLSWLLISVEHTLCLAIWYHMFNFVRLLSFVVTTLQNAPAWTNLGLIYLLNDHIEVSCILISQSFSTV